MSEEKPYAPSAKRLKKAREEGQLVKSQLLSQSVVIFSISLGMIITLSLTIDEGIGLFRYALLDGWRELRTLAYPVTVFLLKVLLTNLIIAAGLSIMVETLQVGLVLSWGLVAPKFDRCFNLESFWNKLVQGFAEVWLPCLKLICIGLLAWYFLSDAVATIVQLIFVPISGQITVLHRLLTRVSIGVGLSLFVLGAFEYYWRRRKFFKEQSMTKEEMKQEYRESEGDPHVKMMRKSMHQQLSRGELVKRVRGARCVVVEKKYSQ